MAVTGVHALIYTPEVDALRRVLTAALGWSHVDAGQGWLIFALPPAELGIHPDNEPHHELSLMCDDLATTIDELSTAGVTFRGEPEDRGWGITTTMVLPGGVDVVLYEPRHPTAHRRT
jgi:Glyoxalase/Bleomycin resistance protein/Dioxygenase superfamily